MTSWFSRYLSDPAPEDVPDHAPQDAMLPKRMVMFATGIECLYPVILNGTHRVDELALTGHYERWRDDLFLVRDLGIRFLRYGFPYHLVNPLEGVYNWEFCDLVMNEMRRLGITPILDVCHFGLPNWLGNSFQNPDFPRAFAKYARDFLMSPFS